MHSAVMFLLTTLPKTANQSQVTASEAYQNTLLYVIHHIKTLLKAANQMQVNAFRAFDYVTRSRSPYII